MDNDTLGDLKLLLGQKRGMEARFWLYLQSLRQLHIQIGSNGAAKYGDLICYRCWHIDGPTEWVVGDLTITAGTSGRLVLEDDVGGFRVECELMIVSVWASTIACTAS
jgi:hypothetical protein